MLKTIRLQSRRFGLTFALLAVATPAWALSLVGEGYDPVSALTIAGAASFALYLMLCGLILGTITVPALRGWRVAAETTGMASLLLSAMALVLPGTAQQYALCLPSASAAIWIGLYGPLARLVPQRITQVDTARIHIPLPHQMVWRMALPTRPSEHWDPLLRASVQDCEDADTFHLDYARGNGETDSVCITMLEIEPNRGYRYLFQGESSGVGRAFAQGYHQVLLIPDGEDATWVELSRKTEDCLPAQRLLSWLDRAPEDYAEFLRASTLGEPMTGTLTGLHRLAVLREELDRKRRRPKMSASRSLALLQVAAQRTWALLIRAPSMISW
ncbi:hypothetical protein [Jannaschia formosa]|uniref:hypothetical protein n=1 Tax=Jannaschia formosa TaxID=2259592 RepID=UPI000E1BCFE5|nr:hypothetical protein [Jannaschia formosa]TFL17858.1 hypothetical protein DR046_11875 [Jannaschia formosa]